MSGIEAISSRILEIQTTVASFSARAQPAMGTLLTQATSQSTTLQSATSSATAFDLLLAQAQATTTTATSTPGTFSLNADGIPSDLAAYGNGQVPAAALASVGSTGHKLWTPAAGAFETLLAAAKADGVDIGITDSYRTYDSQVDLAERKGLYSDGGLAAKPGTSDHGWGLSLDLKLDTAALSWMRTNGATYGFAEDVPREPWHWTFQGADA
ncbi:M15 family metallopeptidase [Sanguibacter gelidistatuariae]|uniref:M15 family metallopeptidase n=1 Tax=Sanguibacter gelidistatuariae TaxID=1814289 RepID=UPI001FE00F6F|nr:M15 family metallopeptidase [Sanguibacter gelidistatuariae]